MKNVKRILLAILIVGLLCVLCGCSSTAKVYDEAQKLFSEGKYAEAADKFNSIGAYEDATTMAVYSRAIGAGEAGDYDTALSALEMLAGYKDSAWQKQYYQGRKAEASATAYRESGDRQQYDDFLSAIRAYGELGLFRDSDTRQAACADLIFADAGQALQDGDPWFASLLYGSLDWKDSSARSVYAAGRYHESEARFLDAAECYGQVPDVEDAADRKASCLKQAYDAAKTLMDNGEYENAIVAFTELKDYRDSPAMIEACRAALLDWQYGEAVALYEAGKLDEAIAAFTELKDYQNSPAMIEECRAILLERQYGEAAALYEAGKLDEAMTAFLKLDDYKDCALRVTQISADQLFDSGSYAEAWEIYATLDAARQTRLSGFEDLYGIAEKQRTEGSLQDALSGFTALGNYGDSGVKAAQVQADTVYASGDMAGAWTLYAALPEAYRTHEADYAATLNQAETLRADGRFDEAIALYQQLGDYQQAAEQIAPVQREKAEAAETAGDYQTAMDLYALLGDQGKVDACVYAVAEQYAAAGQWIQASETWMSIPGYQDSREKNYLAGAALTESDPGTAVTILSADPEYQDAKDLLYQMGETALENESYELAVQIFGDLIPYRASAMEYDAAVYLLGCRQAEQGQYNSAALTFISLGDLSNAPDKALRYTYQYAVSLQEQKLYSNAIDLYEAVIGYEDTAERIRECNYLIAGEKMEKGQYEDAQSIYASLKDYKDSAALCTECVYLRAEETYGAGKLSDAETLYLSVDPYKDTDTKLKAVYHDQAEQCLQGKDYKKAYDLYLKAGDWSDSAEKAKQAAYEYGLERLSAKDYDNALAYLAKDADHADAKAQIRSIGDYMLATEQTDAAYTVYAMIPDYEDLTEKIYAYAGEQEKADALPRALELYSAIPDYQDSGDRIAAIHTELTYREALELIQKSRRKAALELLKQIPGYKDVDSLITKYSVQVGEYMTFGHYEQDNNTANGPEEIEWLVLDVQDEKVLLISRYALDCQPYNMKNTSVTWENCSLRTWLNSTFINKAFTAEEQKAVLTTTVDNGKSQGYYNTDGGSNTQDKVFLLSYAEAKKFFDNVNSRECQLTEYAIAQNSYMATNGNCYWLLRSPGPSLSSVCAITSSGAPGTSIVNSALTSVRPALWVDMIAVNN